MVSMVENWGERGKGGEDSMENGGWRMEDGKWKMENGRWTGRGTRGSADVVEVGRRIPYVIATV
jgi:hypothetical protein